MTTTIIDTPSSLTALLPHLENQPTDPPSLYLDIEGIKLSRHGSISILQLFHLPQNHIYLIDIFLLQNAAFDTPHPQSATTLRSILESPTIPKCFFDVRNDADALFAHFHVALQNVHDLQLLEVATRAGKRPRNRVAGLRSCIKYDARLSREARLEWEAGKDRGKALFSEEEGGSYEVFNVRPMLREIVDYCAQDVVYLPVLWEVYAGKVSGEWWERVRQETRKRVLMSQAEGYEPHGRDKVLSPWGTAVKAGTSKNVAKESRAKPAVGGTEQVKKPTPAEVSAAKALHRKAEKQPWKEMTREPPAESIQPQTSKLHADSSAVQMSPAIITETLLPQTRPLKESKGKANATVPANRHTKTASAIPDNEWTCTACSRKMLKSQQADHEAGKPHINRLKQMASAKQAATPKPTAGKKTRQGSGKKAGPAATCSSQSPTYSNWEFIVSARNRYPMDCEDYYYEKEDNF
ncbi:MAG: hypothetical protein Q9195_003234 [Heterodermia aff. obscurata]